MTGQALDVVMFLTIFFFQVALSGTLLLLFIGTIYIYLYYMFGLKEKLGWESIATICKKTVLHVFVLSFVLHVYFYGEWKGVVILVAITCIAIATKIMIPFLKENGFFRRKKNSYPPTIGKKV